MVFLARMMLGIGMLALLPHAGSAATREYDLVIATQEVTMTGTPVQKITVNGTIPAPVLYFTEGDEAVIRVTNRMDEMSSIHWHGLLLPGFMDGAPGFNGFKGIAPGETFTYRFPIRQSGTYWYHSHSLGQEQDGLYGALVIAPKAKERPPAAREYVVVLSDFSEESATEILRNLKKTSEYYQNRRRTVGDFFEDIEKEGLKKTLKETDDWGQMRMLRTDLSDVTGYTFLTNGKTPEENWTGIFTPGETLRLRFVNAAAMTMYDVRIPGLTMTIVAADGQPVEPVEVDEFRFGVAETYDVMVTPSEDKAYSIVAESLDREGFSLGTLAPREGMRGKMPDHRPRAQLTMADMNMQMMMEEDPEMDMSDPSHMESGWAKTGAPVGARVLAYEDLRFQGTQADTREPTREIAVRLGGMMGRYIWTMNGKKFAPDDGFHLDYNERVRFVFINETMMAHPVHLHGMFMQLENGSSNAKLPNKHTIIVPPGQTVSALLTANEPGSWPMHCHLLYHMISGMMTTVTVAEPPAKDKEARLGSGALFTRFTPMAQEGTEHHSGHDSADAEAHVGHDLGFIPHAFILELDAGRTNRSTDVAAWDFDGWVGGDLNKLWLKSEGDISDSDTEQAELWAMWSRNVSEFWDVQLGARYDWQPHAHEYLVAGVSGLAPYFIETELHGFIRDDGDVSARLRVEHEALLTNRLILRPRLEVDANASEDRAEDLGTGLTDMLADLQLRYEITRQFAPYLALRYEQKFGDTADFARESGEQTHITSLNAGIRFLF